MKIREQKLLYQNFIAQSAMRGKAAGHQPKLMIQCSPNLLKSLIFLEIREVIIDLKQLYMYNWS